MNVSPEILKPFSNYCIGQSDLGAFRDQMVDLRLDRAKYDSLREDDKEFLHQFEGRYAEFSDGLVSEKALRKSLALLIVPEAASLTSVKYFFSCNPSTQSSAGSGSISSGEAPTTRNAVPALC